MASQRTKRLILIVVCVVVAVLSFALLSDTFENYKTYKSVTESMDNIIDDLSTASAVLVGANIFAKNSTEY